jgi:hypothetical protein
MPYAQQGVLADHSQVSGGTLRAGHTLWRSMIRRCYVCIALFMIAMVLAGFWPSYFGPLTRGVVQHPWVIHLHAATFMGWMALLLTQVILVSTGRTRAHKKLGTFGIGYGVLVLGIGLMVSFAAPLHHLAAADRRLDEAADLLLGGLSDMALFGAFFGAAIAQRRRPETHKRLIIVATVALLLPGAGRLVIAVFGLRPLMVLLVWLSPLLIAMGYDLVTRRRVHPIYLIGTLVLAANIPWRLFVIRSEAALSAAGTLLTTLR